MSIQTKYKGINYEISINPLPEKCTECPFFLHYTDNECGYYDCDYCQFNAKEIFGAALYRVKDCPLGSNYKEE